MNRSASASKVGIVAIGRNEGDRLKACLRAAIVESDHVIYVDSGSTDGSVDFARSLGVKVVELDLSVPFTAARARNAGWRYSLEALPRLEAIQFLDGDCEIIKGWLAIGHQELMERSDVAAVSGRRRERYRDATIYNRMIDMEWETPIGEVRSCHGDVMMRPSALSEIGGFDASVIAAEDDEICVRLRAAGWKIVRLDADMSKHDAAMLRFGQWWKRAERCGHGYAQGFVMHGRPPERHFASDLRRTLVWGFVLPVLILAFAWATRGFSFIALFLYLMPALRSYQFRVNGGDRKSDALIYSAFTIPAKFAGVLGAFRYFMRYLFRRSPQLIEYK